MLSNMVLKHKTLNLLVVCGVVFLLFGTSVMCVLGQAAAANPCCVESKTSTHHESSLPGSKIEHDSCNHKDGSSSGRAPEKSKPDYCCSKWYQFTAGAIKWDITKPSPLSSTLASDSPNSICYIADTAPKATAGIESSANSRAPDRPLYLATHSLRI